MHNAATAASITMADEEHTTNRPPLSPEEWQRICEVAETVRHEPAVGPPPCGVPETFGPAFRPPAHTVKLLQQKFETERDRQIEFFELPHVYTVKGKAYDSSITSLVKAHCSEFNADEIISKMMNSRRQAWPRLKYAVDARKYEGMDETEATTLCVLLVNGEGDTVFAGRAGSVAQARQQSRSPAASTCVAYLCERGMTKEEILQSWDDNRIDASNRGTWIHFCLECFMNSIPHHPCSEMEHGLKFIAHVLAPMGVKAYRTEWEVFGEQEGICGSIDFVGYFEHDPDKLIIVDWKRAKDLTGELHNDFGKKMSHPLEHLHDVAGCKYALQLSCYSYVLTKYYQKTVTALALCCVHDNDPMHTFCPNLHREVDYLMRKRRELMAARLRASMEAPPEWPRCPITSDLLFDAVRFDGTLYNKQDFQALHPEETSFESVPEETQRVQALVESVRYNVSPEERALSACTPWDILMPPGGIPTLDQVIQ